MKFFYRNKLIKETKKYMEYGKKDVRKISIEELEKIKALKPVIKEEVKRYSWAYRPKTYLYNVHIGKIIKNLTINQINELSECTFGFISYLCEESQYDIDEIIEKIVKPFKGKERYFERITHANFTIEQMEFILKNNLLYDSRYHEVFDYEELYINIKELGLNPSKEYANKIDISIIRNFLKCYPELKLSEKEDILLLVAINKNEKDITRFFNIVCKEEGKNHFTFEELKVILECIKWNMTELAVLFKNCKKEDIFSKMLELKK